MERKRSTSRSPSLSRRPSFKEKKGVTLLAKKKKGTGPSGKKERWLLTRKTWRYMTDAVGNLLPEYRTGSHHHGGHGANAPTTTTPTASGSGSGSGATSRRGSGLFQGGGGSGSGGGGNKGTASPPPGQLQPHQLQQWTMQQQQWVQQHSSTTTFSTGTTPSVSTTSGSNQPQQPKSKPTSPTSGNFPSWVPCSFPSHRPGVTPTGPGPGGQQHLVHHRTGQILGPVNKYINPAVDPEDLVQVEQHFQDVCTKEKKFLLWTRNKPKALSGPALRDLKEKEKRDEAALAAAAAAASPPKKLLLPDYFSPDEFEEDEEDYDEYGAEDEEQITVCERRKSSTASSTISIIGGQPGTSSSFFRPLSSFGQPQHASSSHSETSYSMVGGGPGEAQRVVRHTGIQTDPFPEELLIRLRLQAVHDERQKQIQAMQIQLQRQHHGGQGQQLHHHQGGDHGDMGGNAGSGGDATAGGHMTTGMGPWYGGAGGVGSFGSSGTSGGGGGSGTGGGGGGTGTQYSGGGGLMGLHGPQYQSGGPSGVHHHSGMGAGHGSGGAGSGVNLRSVSLSTSPGGGLKETVIPINTANLTSASYGHSTDQGGGAGGAGLRSQSGSGRESEEKMLEYGGGKTGGAGAPDSTDKKSEESGYSSSISDTVMKYLRIMRKNSKADNKETIDKFKTVNYDRSLRYIKSKNVTVEEALEHEKNKALGLSGKGSGGAGDEQPVSDSTAQQGQSPGQPNQQQQPGTTSKPSAASPSAGSGSTGQTSAPLSPTAPKEKAGGTKVKQKKQQQSQQPPLSPTSSSSPPPPQQHQTPAGQESGQDLITGIVHQGGTSAAATSGGASGVRSLPHLGSPPPTSPLEDGSGSEVEVATPTNTTDKKKGTLGKKNTVKKKVVGAVSGKSESGKVAATNLATEATVRGQQKQNASLSSSSSPQVGLASTSSSGGIIDMGKGTLGQVEKLASPSSMAVDTTGANSPVSNATTAITPNQAAGTTVGGGGGVIRHLRVTSPPKEVGIQAGESLIKYLRKLSDFSSPSESPAELASLSPRLSIATSEGAEWYMHHAQYHHSTTSSGIPTTSRSSFDAFDLYSVGGGDSSASTSEWEDAWVQQLLQYQQLFQQQQGCGGQQQQIMPESSTLLSPPQGVGGGGKGGLSPIPASATGSSGSSGSGSGGGGASSTSYSPRTQHHQLNVKICPSSAPPASGSTPSTPGGGSGSSIMSSSHGERGGGSSGGGGLMKSFFSSSPFSSSFGFRSSSSKKPSSTSSLGQGGSGGGGSTVTTSNSASSVLGRGGGLLGLPPTTSSSPNLLSLVHSTSSGSHSHAHSGGHSSSSGHGFFRSSDRDLRIGLGGSGGGGGGGSTSWAGGMLSRVGSGSRSRSGGGDGGSGGLGSSFGFGSKVPQKGEMNLPLVDNSNPLSPPSSSSSNPVMQKSKSSSSVGGGGGGGGAGTGGGGGRGLISKSSRIFKSRSKSTTRANTSSSGSAPCSWAPQGKCRWRSPSGKTITLESTNALALSELERSTLVEVALEKLKSINLGVEVKLPKEKAASGATTKKRRPYLLKKKALSTGFFEGGKRDEKESSGGSGMVFGISLSTCVANDRLRQGVQGGAGGGSGGGSTATQPPQAATATTTTTTTQGSTPYYRKRSQNGSRNSVADVQMGREDKGSTESLLFWGKRGSVAAVETIPAAVGQPPSMDILQPPLPSVPSIVTACVQHLENYGLHTTGIFRVSTSLKRIRQLREEIDGGKDVEFGEEHSPHDVAALLKEFLRDLPDPLLSRELYQPFLKTQKIRNRKQQLEAVQHLVQLLPAANRDTLASLLAFFAKVVANAGETRSSGGELLPGNKMEGYSLATLIAPNILPCMEGGGTAGSGDHTLTKERRESIDVVNYMISNYTQLFEISPELLHDVYLHLMDTQPEAVEGLLKIKSGFVDDANDEMETSSVFEGSECGDLPEGEEVQTPQPQQRVFRRREDILHEGAAHGGPISGHSHHTSQPATAAAEPSGRLRGSDRVRGRRDSSRDRSGGAAVSDQEKGGQSGAESDTSSTKSSSRWFRRTRPDKTRTSSDSGSEKVKCFTSGGIATAHPTQKSGLESKRANSLDSVNMKESCSQGGGGGSSDVTGGATSQKEKSNSDQSLKVPENLNRRQSSPVLESAGVITASLKIPVPVPLNIDDTDIPFIEEDHQHHHSHYSSTRQHPIVPAASSTARSRGRSASTDSSAPIKSPQSSHTTTPISSPGRQPSSEVSSPLGFSPPGSPPYDTFPYEEMTARILLGGTAGTDQVTASTSTSTTMTSSVDKVVPAKVVTSLYLQPAANTPNANSSNSGGGNSGGPSCQTATASVYIPGVASDGKTHGKETTRHLGILSTTPSSGSAIGGLIKSKTADFEKLSKSTANSPTSSTATLTYSIAPKMRLRSQENIVLKQQFLLRQQQLQQQHPHYAHPSQEEGRRRDASNTPTPPPQTTSGHEANHKSTTVRSPSVKDMTTTEQQQQHGSPTHSPTSKSSPGSRGLTRRRQPLTGSASSSAIIPSSSHHSSSSLTSSDHHRPHHGSRHPPTVTEPQTVPTPAGSSGGGSPSRWKRSEIIASRHDDSPSDHGSGGGSSRSIGGGGGGTPETFL